MTVTPTSTRRKEELLTRVDLTELVDALGLERKGKDARCPNHNDTGRPNLHIYKDRVHCFACDFNVDAFGLVEKVEGARLRRAPSTSWLPATVFP
jgi:DNA primase